MLKPVARELGEQSHTLAVAGIRQRIIDAVVAQGILLASVIAWVVPWPVWHLVSSAAGIGGMGLKWRRIVLDNVRHVRALDPPPRVVAWYLGAQQIATHCKTVISVLRASVRPPSTRHLVIEGIERVEPFLGTRGIVIVAPHAGPYPTLGMIASQWLLQRGSTIEFAVVARLFRPFRSGVLMDWFIRCFARAGVTVVPITLPPRELGLRLRQILEARGIVALFVDEPSASSTTLTTFFDSQISLPAGPVRLARSTGSVILPCIATYGRSRTVTMTVAEPIEPNPRTAVTLQAIARSLESLIRNHLDQWSMLTPIWAGPPLACPPAGHSFADLHLHTTGSDGLCTVDEWVAAADSTGVSLLAITDHDHIATIRAWRGQPGASARVAPGVELTARGRIVHLNVLFTGDVPEPAALPRPGTPLVECVRWARSIPGSIVVLVHPLPLLWRAQLRRLARVGLLPDAVETRFPLVGWRGGALERAAAAYGIATVGGSDAHIRPTQIGRHVTVFPGETLDDLASALRARATRPVTRPGRSRPSLVACGLQVLYSWLLPFQHILAVKRARGRILALARAAVRPGQRQPGATRFGGKAMTVFGTDPLVLLTTYGYLVLFIIVLLEEAGVPLPLPSDLLLLYVGTLVGSGALNVGLAVAAVALATLIGTMILYSLARYGGRPLLRRYGRWIRINEGRLTRAEQWLGRRVLIRLIGLRLVPGLRIYSTIAAGALALPRGRAAIAFGVSGVIWAAAWIGLGVVLGPRVATAAAFLQSMNRTIGVALAGVALLVASLALARLLRRWTKRGAACTPLAASIIAAGALALSVAAFAGVERVGSIGQAAGWVEDGPEIAAHFLAGGLKNSVHFWED